MIVAPKFILQLLLSNHFAHFKYLTDMACAAVPKIAQCLSSFVGVTGQALSTVYALTASNTIVTAVPSEYIPIYIQGPGVTCATVTLVADTHLAQSGQTAPVAAATTIAVQVKKGSIQPDAWRQQIRYTTGATGYAAGTTQLVADLLPGYYEVFGTIQVGATGQTGITADVNARINIVTVRENL
jgi:hypothetical protein